MSAAPVPARSPNFGHIEGLAQEISEADVLDIFRKTCVSRLFDMETAKAYDAGAIKLPIYLAVGQEHIAAAISTAFPKPLIFGQHRAQPYYLSYGGDMRALIDELLSRETGCARGMGGSASIHDPKIGMFGHSGLMGDQVPIAVGAALGSKRNVLTVVGDASVEEDYVFGALGYAVTKKLPLLLVCEDNDRSILTPVAVRRSWSMVDVAKGLGMAAVDISDDPWLIAHHVRALAGRLPALINIRTCRQWWHAGTGNDGPPEWNRFELFKEELGRLGLGGKARTIEAAARELVQTTWQEQLRKP